MSIGFRKASVNAPTIGIFGETGMLKTGGPDLGGGQRPGIPGQPVFRPRPITTTPAPVDLRAEQGWGDLIQIIPELVEIFAGPQEVPQVPPEIIPGPIDDVIQQLIPGGQAGAQQAALSNSCPKGYQPNKSEYYTKAGFVGKGTRCVKIRRRNSLNPRALTRSLDRIKGFKNASKKASLITVRDSCPTRRPRRRARSSNGSCPSN